jgi:hypothetical protein
MLVRLPRELRLRQPLLAILILRVSDGRGPFAL